MITDLRFIVGDCILHAANKLFPVRSRMFRYGYGAGRAYEGKWINRKIHPTFVYVAAKVYGIR